MTKEAAILRGLVDLHTAEVEPMLDRLATVNDADRLAEAVEQVLASGARFRFTSELEAAILKRLGHRLDDAREHQNTRRMRRIRGLACPQCFDSGWTVDDDLTARPCDCSPRPAADLQAVDDDPPDPRAGAFTLPDEVIAHHLDNARAALRPRKDIDE